MRAVTLGDLDVAARVILRADNRVAAAEEMLRRAAAADLYRKRLGKLHRSWGNGTLSAAALSLGPPAPSRTMDSDYAAAMVVLIKVWGARGRDLRAA